MPVFGTQTTPVRNHPDHPININTPAGFMNDPPGDQWWLGMHYWWDSTWWQSALPASVTRATSIIVNPLVRMPWNVVDSNGVTHKPTDPDYPPWLRDPMLLNGTKPGPRPANAGASSYPMIERQDRFDLFARWVRDALQLGIGLLEFQVDKVGQPVTGSLHRGSATDLRLDDNGRDWLYRDAPIDALTGTYQQEKGGPLWRLLILRHSLPTGVFGRHRAQLELAARITSYGNESLNANTPSGVLSTEQPINQAQADDTRDEWERTQTRRRIAVLGNGARYQQVTMSPVEAELVAMARLSNEQVAHMFELGAGHLDASTNSMTYSNVQDNRQELVDGPLASWSARIEETIGALLPWGQRMQIDFTQYTTPTTTGGSQWNA